MTDKSMTDNEIIKALMCFSFWHEGCEKCPYLKRCNKVKRMLTIIDTIDALALINRQQAEIERLHKEIGYWEAETKEARADIDQAVAEAIKEFAERFKESLLIHEGDFAIIEPADIDNLVKETVGDSDA